MKRGVGGGAGFSSYARIFFFRRGEGRDLINHSPLLLFVFNFKAEISWRAPVPLFRPGSVHIGSVS